MVDIKAKGKKAKRQDWASDEYKKPQRYERCSMICIAPEDRLGSWELRSHLIESHLSSIK